MLLKNIHAVRSDRIMPCDMRIEHGKIAAFGKDLTPYENEEVIDGGGAYAFAGLIDTHTHGAMGSVYYNLNSDVDTVLAFEAREGVTMAAATLESAPIDKEIELTRHLLPFFEKKSGRAKLGGIHFEGPFLNPAKKGAMNPDGMFLSNGPGDPEDVTEVITLVKELRGKLPIFGICLGHQMISLAYGAKTYKLKFGHRGGNHPVKNLATGKIEITSQNHSYAVDAASVEGTGLAITHINLLDNTVEGVECKADKVFSVQYHPESAPGPQDSSYLFDKFIDIMRSAKGEDENA